MRWVRDPIRAGETLAEVLLAWAAIAEGWIGDWWRRRRDPPEGK